MVAMAAARTNRLEEPHRLRLASLQVRRPEALARILEADLVERGLESGARLGTKADLRERYGVATTTVNEAIRVLEHRGVVHSKPGPGGGVFVSERSGWLALSQLVLGFKHSRTAAAEVLAVRDALEPLIASDAARHHRKRDLVDLRRLLKAMGSQVDDPAGYLRTNWAFHRRIADMCENDFARGLYDGLLDFAESQLADVEAIGVFDGSTNLAVHQALLDAIASRDGDSVLTAVAEHNKAARSELFGSGALAG